MSLSLVAKAAPWSALQAAAVTVEVHLANGLPNFTLVGARGHRGEGGRGERVRSAIQNCGA